MEQLDRILTHYSFLNDELESVRQVMTDTLRTGYAPLDGPLNRYLDNPGKMLRPLMVLISSRFGPEDRTGTIHRLAAAVEILHVASLIHDDIIDEAPRRRGARTLHTSEGIRKAVLLGDFMFTRCISLVSDSVSPGDAGDLAAAVGRICESEISQHWNGNDGHRGYRRRIAGKTALLFSLSLSAGAKECGADEETVQNLRRAGYAIGMSFQIIDDILDYADDDHRTGKQGGQDLQRGIENLPLLLASETANPAIERLKNQQRRSRRSVRHLRQAVVKGGGIEKSGLWASRYDRMAGLYISRLPGIPARQILEDLSGAVSLRKE